MDENIETIKIDEDGKYVIILEFDDVHKLRYEYVERLTKALSEWWNSTEKFFVVFNNKEDGISVRFERMGKDG